MSELRQCPVSGKWVVLAKERARRPETFRESEPAFASDVTKEDPFAEGNEDLNQPELLVYSKESGRKINSPGWQVRVFENKYPAFTFFPGDRVDLHQYGPYHWESGIGSHEVIVTVDPQKHPALLGSAEMALMLRAYSERFAFHANNPDIRYICIIYNHGARAGASIAHPHSQLFAFSFITNDINDELVGAHKYYESRGKCVFCALNAFELKENKRVLMATDNFITYLPYASRSPFEMWIVPRFHDPFYENMSEDRRVELGDHLREALNKLYQAFHDPAYNYFIHSAPCDRRKYEHYHWHLEIRPQFSKIAGFELATGMFINTMPPEQAAEFLRKVS